MFVGWYVCELGIILDILLGYWGVYQEVFDGDIYVGLIICDDGLRESIG